MPSMATCLLLLPSPLSFGWLRRYTELMSMHIRRTTWYAGPRIRTRGGWLVAILSVKRVINRQATWVIPTPRVGTNVGGRCAVGEPEEMQAGALAPWTRCGELWRAGFWLVVLTTNLKSAFLLSQAAGAHMLPRRSGSIVHFASLLSYQGGLTVPAYAAAKGGIAQMVKALANEWSKDGVRVNAVVPGYIRTDMNEKLLADPTRLRQISERIPAGRWGEPEDFAGPVVFLASKASMYVCGELVVVDGLPFVVSIWVGGVPLFDCAPHRSSAFWVNYWMDGWVGDRLPRIHVMYNIQLGKIWGWDA
ncbi:hypothetical protein BJ912DRAFT_930041 [Pholiota molesta]|nr:hypothetical protein BJ912DRAFT_930041 [Pholiota molesta]